ncbi:DsbA family protein [Alloscardovia omnicolens]|uniref:DsbA family protein n=1 Tax=Alloscardovia omnicolens TaxID=419015 RepID=UPI003A72CD2F
MAKNSEKRAISRKTRMEARAAAEREAQLAAERERKIQTAIGASVVAVIVVVACVIAFFVGRNIYLSTRSAEEVAAKAYAAVEKVKDKPKNASKDGGFIISKNGVNKPISNVPTIDDYMDYICPACGTMHRSAGATLAAMVNAGQINLNIHPSAFLNASSTDQYSTRSAAFVAYVADNEPEKVLELIEAMFAQNFQPQEASGYKSVSNDALVKLAKSVGVSDTVAEAAGKGTYEKWINAVSQWYPVDSKLWHPSGTYKGQMTTPTVLINGHYWDYTTAPSSYAGNYANMILHSIGLEESQVGKEGVLPSIGAGKPVAL